MEKYGCEQCGAVGWSREGETVVQTGEENGVPVVTRIVHDPDAPGGSWMAECGHHPPPEVGAGTVLRLADARTAGPSFTERDEPPHLIVDRGRVPGALECGVDATLDRRSGKRWRGFLLPLPRMRYFLLGVAGVILVAGHGHTGARGKWADRSSRGSLGERRVGAWLQTIAHNRVVEISSCGTCMNHDRMRAGTAEVLGYNAGYLHPIARVIQQWRASPVHNAILSDRGLRRIGCAERVVGAKHYFACVLAGGG